MPVAAQKKEGTMATRQRLNLMRAPLLLAALVSLTVPARAQMQLEDPLSPDKLEKVRQEQNAPLKAEELEGHASKSPEGNVVVLQVKNNCKRALLLDGDNALLLSSDKNGNQAPLKRNEIVKPPAKVNIPSDLIYVGTALVTNGSAQTVQDFIQRRGSTQGLFYGLDDKRRQIAGLRFGKRIVYPGETSLGRLYFDKPVNGNSQITLRVLSHPAGASLGEITLPVSLSEAGHI